MRGTRISLIIVAVLALGLGAGAYALVHRTHRPGDHRGPTPHVQRTSIDARLEVGTRRLDAILVGGGAEPESSGVQLEQDVELARTVLGRDAFVLFGAGPHAMSVRTLGPDVVDRDSVHATLTELFDPRDRTASYRATRLRPDGPATRENLLHVLASATRTPGPALTLFVAAHGAPTPNDEPRDAAFDLWSGDAFTVQDLVSIQFETARPIISVITSCYGGAFADAALDMSTEHVSCGLFATTYDRVASGCDDNPQRSAQEGFSLHFFAALRSTDRTGKALARSILDVDGDGRISYLEAHARARIASRGFDVPTTTSERLLRELTVGANVDAAEPSPDAIEDFVIAALAAELEAPTIEIARAMLARMSDELAAFEEEILEAETLRDEAYRRIRIVLLERWPMLDDPWHPAHPSTLAREGRAIAATLTSRPELATYRAQNEALATLTEAYDAKAVEESRVLRLVRAMENVRMLTLVRARGGHDLERYEAVRACERGP